jgi:hypothetical protein
MMVFQTESGKFNVVMHTGSISLTIVHSERKLQSKVKTVTSSKVESTVVRNKHIKIERKQTVTRTAKVASVFYC